MAISSRGEGGVGGGGRGMMGGGMKAIQKLKPKKKAAPRKLAEPKSAVKVVSPTPAGMRKAMNDYATAQAQRVKSGKAAKSAESARAANLAAKKANPKKIVVAKGKKPRLVGKFPPPAERNGVRVIIK